MKQISHQINKTGTVDVIIIRATITHILFYVSFASHQMKSFTGHAMQLLMLQKIGLFTCCIDRGVGAIPGVEHVAHSSISHGLLEIFVTAWCPLPSATNETVMCT